MNRGGLSLRRRNERRTTKGEENNPPVICIDKDEQAEMGLCQSANNSQAEERESSSQGRNCSSPILFPSQDNEVMKEDEEDCLEIVDDKRECTEDSKTIETPKKDLPPSHSRVHTYKGKALSLGKKRQVDCELNNGDDDATKPKERRLMGEEIYSKIECEQKPNAFPQKESLAMRHPLTLSRPYKCKHKVCQTLEEADKLNLYFAPSGIKQSIYSQVIVDKFESYRKRLYNAQSCLVQYHPYGNPIAPAGPLLRRRQTKAKRTSVLMKNTQEIDDKMNKDTIDLVENLEISKKTNDEAMVETILKYDGQCSDTNQDAKTPPLRSPSPKQKDVQLTEDNDVVLETKCTVDKSSQSVPVASHESNSSPVKPRFIKKLRRTILEEMSSDEELPRFNLRKPEKEEKPNEPEKPKEPEIPKRKQESVIVSSKENAPTRTSDAEEKETADKRQQYCHECPMCFKMFQEDRIETHAAICNGSTYEVVRRSARDSPLLEQDEEFDADPQRSVREDFSSGQTEEQYKLSPTIKVRTPTKVRELKLMSPSLSVRNLADEFSSEPKQGESVNMFGYNVMLSPGANYVAEYAIKKKSFVSSEDEKNDFEKRKTKEEVTHVKKIASRGSGIIMETKPAGCEVSDSSKRSEPETPKVNIRQAETNPRWLNATKSATKTRDSSELIQVLHRETSPLTASTKIVSDVKRSWHVDKDFLPLECEREEDFEKPESNSLPSNKVSGQTSSVTSISSSEDESNEIIVRSSSKTMNDEDALELLNSGYKGRKRKGENVVQEMRKKRPKNPELDERVELCTFCQKHIPSRIYAQHIEEEIAKKRKGGNKEVLKTGISSPRKHQESQSETSRIRNNLKSRNLRQSEVVNQPKPDMLPDFAEATISNVDKEQSPLKTFEPLDSFPNPNIDYHNQFASGSESRGAAPCRKKYPKRIRRKQNYRK